jgi:hypothetical protein
MQGDISHDPVQHTDPAARYAASRLFDLSVPSVCLLCLIYLSVSSLFLILHLSVSSTVLSSVFFVFLLVLRTAHLYVSLSVCSVCFFCLPHLSGLSAVCLTVYHMSFFLSVCLSFLPLHLAHSTICLHSLCVYFCICAGILF